MTAEDFIKTTQPIVDLVTAVAKIKYGEHSERFLVIVASIMDAQAKKDVGILLDYLDVVSSYIDSLSYDIKKRLTRKEEDEPFFLDS